MLWSWLEHVTRDAQSPFCYDSEYAASVARGEWMADTNEVEVGKKDMTTLSVMIVRMVWPSVARKANTTMPMKTTRGPSLQWQRITQPRTVRLRISPRTNSSPYVVKVRKRFWAGAPPPFSGSPFTMEDRNTAADYKRRLKETWTGIHREQGTGREIPIRTEYHRLNREFRKFKYKAKQEYIRQVCTELEGAMEAHDMGRF